MTSKEPYYRITKYKGQPLLYWALLWFRLSNDDFYMLYGFNFNPHKYPGLYEIAQKMTFESGGKTPLFLQKVFNTKNSRKT